MVDINPYTKNIITIRLDADLLKEFSGYDKSNPETYFQTHPRAKKAPFEALWGKTRQGLIPSINKFLNVGASNSKAQQTAKNTNLARVTQNNWEDHLKKYCTYAMKKQGIKASYLDKCIVVTIQFKPTASKSDNPNIYDKPFLDAIVGHEVLIDDNYTHLQYYSAFSVVDRKDPHSEIRIYPIDDTYPFEIVMLQVTADIVELHQQYADSFEQTK